MNRLQDSFSEEPELDDDYGAYDDDDEVEIAEDSLGSRHADDPSVPDMDDDSEPADDYIETPAPQRQRRPQPAARQSDAELIQAALQGDLEAESQLDAAGLR